MTKPNGSPDGLNGLARFETLYDEVDYSGDEEDDILRHILADNVVEDAPTFPLLGPPCAVVQETRVAGGGPQHPPAEITNKNAKEGCGTDDGPQHAANPEGASSKSEGGARKFGQGVELADSRRSESLASPQGEDRRTFEGCSQSQSRAGDGDSGEDSRVPSVTSSASDRSAGKRLSASVSKAIEKLEFRGDLDRERCRSSDLSSIRTAQSGDLRNSDKLQVRRSPASPASQSSLEVNANHSRRRQDSCSWRKYEPEGAPASSGAIGVTTQTDAVITPPYPRTERPREPPRGSSEQLEPSSTRRRRSGDVRREARRTIATSTGANLVPLSTGVERISRLEMPPGVGLSPANSDRGSERSGRPSRSDSHRRDRRPRRRGGGDTEMSGANLEPVACERTRKFDGPLVRGAPTSPVSGRRYNTPSPTREVPRRDNDGVERLPAGGRTAPRDDPLLGFPSRADDRRDMKRREERLPVAACTIDLVRRTGANLEPVANERARRFEDPIVLGAPTSPAAGRYYESPCPIRGVHHRKVEALESPFAEGRTVLRSNLRPSAIPTRVDERRDVECRDDRRQAASFQRTAGVSLRRPVPHRGDLREQIQMDVESGKDRSRMDDLPPNRKRPLPEEPAQLSRGDRFSDQEADRQGRVAQQRTALIENSCAPQKRPSSANESNHRSGLIWSGPAEEGQVMKKPRITDRLGVREDIGPSRLRQREHWRSVSKEMNVSTPAAANDCRTLGNVGGGPPKNVVKEELRPLETPSVVSEGAKRDVGVDRGEGWEIRREPSVHDRWSRAVAGIKQPPKFADRNDSQSKGWTVLPERHNRGPWSSGSVSAKEDRTGQGEGWDTRREVRPGSGSASDAKWSRPKRLPLWHG